MTIPADAFISFTAGHVFAMASSNAIEHDREDERACLERSRLFTALVTVPISTLFVFLWPDWSWMYLTGDKAKNRLTGVFGVWSCLIANELGFRNAARLIRQGKKKDALTATAVSVAPLMVLSVIGAKRLLLLGTREDYVNGEATLVLRHKGFLFTLFSAGALAGPPALAVLAKNFRQVAR